MPGFLRFSYWFNPQPVPFLPVVDRVLLVVFAAFVLVAVAAWTVMLRPGWDKTLKQVMRRVAEASFWLGVFGLVLYWLTNQRIYVLGARAGYLLWLVVFVWYLWSIGRLALIEIPERKKREEERREFEKWIPKKK